MRINKNVVSHQLATKMNIMQNHSLNKITNDAGVFEARVTLSVIFSEALHTRNRSLNRTLEWENGYNSNNN